MKMKSMLQSFALRRALSAALAVVLSFYCAFYFNLDEITWMLLATFVANRATVGAPFKQSILTILLFSVIVMLAFALQMITVVWVKESVIALILLLGAGGITIWLLNSLRSTTLLFFPLLFFGVATLSVNKIILPDALVTILVGGLIGLLCNLIVFPLKPAKEFRLGLLPILRALQRYLQTLQVAIKEGSLGNVDLINDQRHIINALQSSGINYPEWVYLQGFNPGLRSGFRFFLINIEHLTELFFSINYYASTFLLTLSKEDRYQDVFINMDIALQRNEELLKLLHDYLANDIAPNAASDFTSDITKLDEALNKVTPESMELLDISPDYLPLITVVRDIKDARKRLLQLVMAVSTR